MHANDSTDVLADVARRLDAASALIDRLVGSDNYEVSYAATTAALHLHAAQAELPAPTPSEAASPADGEPTPVEVADALAGVVALISNHASSLPAEAQTTLARVLLHLAEARDVLRETAP